MGIQALAPLQIDGEIDHDDRVLLDDADQRMNPDGGDEIELES
jgi:hypothetical protein